MMHFAEDHREFDGPPRGRGGRGRSRGVPGGEPFGASFFGRGPRAARGDVRAAIISLLGEQPMHGYQIIGELRERSGGVWKASPGSVYPTLQLLEDEGLVSPEASGGKRIFHLTEAGRELLASRPAGASDPWDEVGAGADTAQMDLRAGLAQLAGAVRQVAHAGSSSQMATAKKVLSEARRAIYRVLAEDGTEDGTDADDGTSRDG